MSNSLSILVHGDSKVGKSWFGDTAPAPRLILDAEGGSRFTPSRKVVWDPLAYAPPVVDGTWDTCIVYVRDFGTIQRVYQWLVMGQHPFKSVVMDSISEAQQRCIDALVGADPMKMQDWGQLLRSMSVLVRQFRDLTIHPTNPLTAVVLIAMTREVNGCKYSYVQGQLSTTLPFYLDVIGYIFTQPDEAGQLVRRMLVAPHPQFQAGERVGGRIGPVIDNPNMEQMLQQIYADPAVDIYAAPAGA